MSAVAAATSTYKEQVRNNRLGLWLFFISEAFIFGGLLVTRFYLWRGEGGAIVRPELDQTLGLIVTSVLLVSSYFMNRAEVAIAHDDRGNFLISLLITAALGIAFLAGVVLFEWGGHLKPSDGVFGAVVYGMTGMHALHVLSGVVFILLIWWNGRKGHFSSEKHWGVEACAIYWHYVDLIWIFFYPALYLIGPAVHSIS